MPPSNPKKTSTPRGSGNPAARSSGQQVPVPDQQQDPRYTPTQWGSAGGIGTTEDLTVPSGQLCLVRRPGLQGLMTAGVLHNVDQLTALVDKKHVSKGKKGKSEAIDAESLMKDPKALADIMHTVDRVVCHVVVQPTVVMTPNDVTNRKPGVVYADTVDIPDKMFIFNYAVGGTRDLETFRRESGAAVGGMEALADVQDSTE